MIINTLGQSILSFFKYIDDTELRGYYTPKGNNSERSSKRFNQVIFKIKINESDNEITIYLLI